MSSFPPSSSVPGLFSLILATKDRVDELERFFIHLVDQEPAMFECIVVDQNEDNRLEPVVRRFCQQFPIIHTRSAVGLSKARNVGLQLARGEFLAFPDDDCWYPAGLLEKAAQIFAANPEWAGFTGVATSGQEGPSRWKWDKTPGRIDRYNVWQRGISITVFLRRVVTDRVGFFDEQLGLGESSIWKSGEETDYLLRIIEADNVLYYMPDFVVYHPDHLPDYKREAQRAFDYGAGMGRVLRLHKYPLHYVLWQCFRPVLTACYSILKRNPDRARYFLRAANGRWTGWLFDHQ